MDYLHEVGYSMNTTIEEFLKNGGEIKQIDSDDQSKIHRKVSFEDQISLMLFACYATTPFSVKDVQEAVFDFHRTTIYSLLQEHVKGGYLERVSRVITVQLHMPKTL